MYDGSEGEFPLLLKFTSPFKTNNRFYCLTKGEVNFKRRFFFAFCQKENFFRLLSKGEFFSPFVICEKENFFLLLSKGEFFSPFHKWQKETFLLPGFLQQYLPHVQDSFDTTLVQYSSNGGGHRPTSSARGPFEGVKSRENAKILWIL